MDGSGGVLLIAELQGNELTSISEELVYSGRELAMQMACACDCAVIGGCCTDAAQKLSRMGLSTVYTVQGPAVEGFQVETHLSAVLALCETINPRVVLLCHTENGADLAASLAFHVDSGLVTNCVALRWEGADGRVHMTSSQHCARAHAEYVVEDSRIQIGTIAPMGFSHAEPVDGALAEIVEVPFKLVVPVRTTVLEHSYGTQGAISLEKAPVVVSGGRGVGSADGFAVLADLADILGGCVGASRPAVDKEWAAPERQIGLTGRMVNPEIYLMFGISGATQHLAGCFASKTIIAVNNDPEAPIFDKADYGVCADWHEAASALIEAMKS